MTEYEEVENVIKLLHDNNYDRFDSNDWSKSVNWQLFKQLLKGNSLLKHRVVQKLSFICIRALFVSKCELNLIGLMNTIDLEPDVQYSNIGIGNWKSMFVGHYCPRWVVDVKFGIRFFDITKPEKCVDLMHRLDSFFDSLLYNILNE
jgi:hypothetical protein